MVESIPAWLVWAMDRNTGKWVLSAIATKRYIAERYRKIIKEDMFMSVRFITVKTLPARIEDITEKENDVLTGNEGKPYPIYRVFTMKPFKHRKWEPDLPSGGTSEKLRAEIERYWQKIEKTRRLVLLTRSKKRGEKLAKELRQKGYIVEAGTMLVNHRFGFECLKAITTEKRR